MWWCIWHLVPGKYCNGSTVTPASCPEGHFCPDGTEFSTQHPCRPGTYNNVTDQTSESACKLCDPGKYCEGFGRIWPNGLCDEGFYCSGGSWSKRPGDIGVANYNNVTSPADSCYRSFECVCPAWNKTTGTVYFFWISREKKVFGDSVAEWLGHRIWNLAIPGSSPALIASWICYM